LWTPFRFRLTTETGGAALTRPATCTAAFALVVLGLVSGLMTVAVMVWLPTATPLTLKVKFWLWPGSS